MSEVEAMEATDSMEAEAKGSDGGGEAGLGLCALPLRQKTSFRWVRFGGAAICPKHGVLLLQTHPSALDTLMPCLVSEGGYSYMAARICAFLAS